MFFGNSYSLLVVFVSVALEVLEEKYFKFAWLLYLINRGESQTFNEHLGVSN